MEGEEESGEELNVMKEGKDEHVEGGVKGQRERRHKVKRHKEKRK